MNLKNPSIIRTFSLVLGLVLLKGTLALAAEQWVPYTNTDLSFEMKRPARWTVTGKGQAMALFGPGEATTRYSFGLLRLPKEGMTITQAYQERFESLGKPVSWTSSPSKFGGARAIKVIAPDEVPGRKRVMYFVERPVGVYFVQCSAPTAEWPTASDLFALMIQSFHFQDGPVATSEP